VGFGIPVIQEFHNSLTHFCRVNPVHGLVRTYWMDPEISSLLYKGDSSMTTQQPKSTSRRGFLKVAAFVGAQARTLAACAPAAAPGARRRVRPLRSIRGLAQTVRYLSWWFEEGNRGITWNNFIKEFNESQTDIEVVAENILLTSTPAQTIVGAQSGELDGDIVMATPRAGASAHRLTCWRPSTMYLTRNNITDLSSAHDAMRARTAKFMGWTW
jgi:hypothetical protein